MYIYPHEPQLQTQNKYSKDNDNDKRSNKHNCTIFIFFGIAEVTNILFAQKRETSNLFFLVTNQQITYL